jgi:hypothetical protein
MSTSTNVRIVFPKAGWFLTDTRVVVKLDETFSLMTLNIVSNANASPNSASSLNASHPEPFNQAHEASYALGFGVQSSSART